MLATQFLAAAEAAHNSHACDELARLTWRAHSEGHLDDATADGVAAALQARSIDDGVITTTAQPDFTLALRGKLALEADGDEREGRGDDVKGLGCDRDADHRSHVGAEAGNPRSCCAAT